MASHRTAVDVPFTLARLLVAALGVTCWGTASATASLGGAISLVGDSGFCNATSQVPLTTQQDSFTLALATSACSSTAASVQMRGDAATASLGVSGSSSGDGHGSSAAFAEVGIVDHWIIGVPPGTPDGTVFTLPVSLTVEGTISPGAVASDAQSGYFSSTVSLIDFYGDVSKGFFEQDFLTTTGNYDTVYNGSVTFAYRGAAVPATLEFSMILGLPGLYEGTADFYNTAKMSMSLPAGFSATTSSGAVLPFSAPVPEPETWLLMGLGLVGLAGLGRRSRTAVKT